MSSCFSGVFFVLFSFNVGNPGEVKLLKFRVCCWKVRPWTLWNNDLCQEGAAAVPGRWVWVNSIIMDICLHLENIWEGGLWDFCVRHEAYSEYLPSYSSAHVSSVSHFCHFYAEKTRNLVIPKLCYICCGVSICFISLSKAECAYLSVYICIHWPFSFYINNILLKKLKNWVNQCLEHTAWIQNKLWVTGFL